MIYRQQILMALIQELGGHIPADRLHLLLFLYCHEFMEHNHYYDFIPSAEGPVSLQAKEDKKALTDKKLLEKSDDWSAAESKKRFAVDLDFFEKTAFQKMKNAGLAEASHEMLLARIAENFPHYSTSPPTASASVTEPTFFTIGYEGRSPEAYLNTLVENGVRLLCDVRKNAYSQKFGFTKGELEAGLKQVGIAYLHIPELGIESEKRQQLNSPADYKVLFEEYDATTLAKQQDKLGELIQLAQQHGRIAITCFEKDAYCCHRGRVAIALKQRDDFKIFIKHL